MATSNRIVASGVDDCKGGDVVVRRECSGHARADRVDRPLCGEIRCTAVIGKVGVDGNVAERFAAEGGPARVCGE